MDARSDVEKQAHYDLISQNTLGKNKGKEPWNKGLTAETDERVALNAKHTSETNKRKAEINKEQNPDYYLDWRNKIDVKMDQNGTHNASAAEARMHKLLVDKYGEEDIIHPYKESRYPFNCDFYVKSEDLFIECNFHWTHGGKPYDPKDLDCEDQLNYWRYKAENALDKDRNYYKNAIYTWTDLDVRKQKIAKQNNLNYLALYKEVKSI